MEQLHALAARHRRLRVLNEEICTLLGVADARLAGQLDGLRECSFDHFFALLQSALDWRDRAPLSGLLHPHLSKSAFHTCCLAVCMCVRVRACERTHVCVHRRA